MKKSKIALLSFIAVLLVIIVAVKVTRPDIISVKLVFETTHTEITFTDTESVQIFQDAIRTTRKKSGSVDVGPPEQRIMVTYDNGKSEGYSIYLNFETYNGYLIKDSDSEKMLALKEKHAKKLAELLSRHASN